MQCPAREPQRDTLVCHYMSASRGAPEEAQSGGTLGNRTSVLGDATPSGKCTSQGDEAVAHLPVQGQLVPATRPCGEVGSTERRGRRRGGA